MQINQRMSDVVYTMKEVKQGNDWGGGAILNGCVTFELRLEYGKESDRFTAFLAEGLARAKR